MIGNIHTVGLLADPIITPIALWLSTTLSVSVATATSMVVAGFSMAASFGISSITRLMAAKPDLRTNVTVREATAPRRTIYGFWHGPGTITYLFSNEQSGWLEQVQTYAGHECEKIGDLYLDKVKVPIRLDWIHTGNSYGSQFSDRVWYHWKRGAPDGLVDLMTYTAFPVQGGNLEWTSDCRQDGCASIYVSLKRSDHFNGLPSIAIDIWGKKIYDPRTATTAWSDNAALCYLDYLITPRNSGGFGATLAEIDTDLFIAAANVCDEAVDLRSGGTEKRYTCNGVYTWDQAPKDIMASLLSSFAGTPTYINGKYGVYAGAWVAPEVTLTDADLRGPIKVQSLVSVRDLCNGVKGKFTSAASDWQPNDFPLVIHRIDPDNPATTVDNDYYLAQDDGYRMWKEIQLPFTTSCSMAQRLARIELESSRRQKTVTWAGKLSCYQLAPPDTLKISRPRFSWTDKAFRVSDGKLVIEQDKNNNPILGMDLTLRETDANVYAWDPAWELLPNRPRASGRTCLRDDFNRADGPLGPNWLDFTEYAYGPSHVFSIVDGHAHANPGNNSYIPWAPGFMWNGTVGDDQSIEAELVHLGNGRSEIHLRLQTQANPWPNDWHVGYTLIWKSTWWWVQDQINGDVANDLGFGVGGDYAFQPGDKLRFEIEGNELRVFINDAPAQVYPGADPVGPLVPWIPVHLDNSYNVALGIPRRTGGRPAIWTNNYETDAIILDNVTVCWGSGSGGLGSWADPDYAIPAPRNVALSTLTDGANQYLQMDWMPPNYLSHWPGTYEVQFRSYSVTDWTTPADSPITGNAIRCRFLATVAGATYYARIRAVDVTGNPSKWVESGPYDMGDSVAPTGGGTDETLTELVITTVA